MCASSTRSSSTVQWLVHPDHPPPNLHVSIPSIRPGLTLALSSAVHATSANARDDAATARDAYGRPRDDAARTVQPVRPAASPTPTANELRRVRSIPVLRASRDATIQPRDATTTTTTAIQRHPPRNECEPTTSASGKLRAAAQPAVRWERQLVITAERRFATLCLKPSGILVFHYLCYNSSNQRNQDKEYT